MFHSLYFERRHDNTFTGWNVVKEKMITCYLLNRTIQYQGNTKNVVIL